MKLFMNNFMTSDHVTLENIMLYEMHLKYY